MSKYAQFACGNCGNAFEDKRLSDDGIVHLRCNTCKADNKRLLELLEEQREELEKSNLLIWELQGGEI